MAFDIEYHPKVHKDIDSLSSLNLARLKSEIDKKLATNPAIFGKPLRGKLAGYKSLRIGNHRLGFKISANSVYILGCLHRSISYKEFEKRIGNR